MLNHVLALPRMYEYNSRSCLLAALSTNHELFIYAAETNYFRGKWDKRFDITFCLVENTMPKMDFVAEQDEEYRIDMAKRVLGCQAVSVDWSADVPVAGPSSSPGIEQAGRSLLAVGHRSGHVTFWMCVLRSDRQT